MVTESSHDFVERREKEDGETEEIKIMRNIQNYVERHILCSSFTNSFLVRF